MAKAMARLLVMSYMVVDTTCARSSDEMLMEAEDEADAVGSAWDLLGICSGSAWDPLGICSGSAASLVGEMPPSRLSYVVVAPSVTSLGWAFALVTAGV